MKQILSPLFTGIFSIISLFCIGQDVKLMEEPEEPDYKNFNPDTSKLLLTRKDVISFCNGVNISNADSTNGSQIKLWAALSDPMNYKRLYGETAIWMAGDYSDPLQANWALKKENDYTKFVLFERFYIPMINLTYVVENINATDNFINDGLERLSAFEKFSEKGIDYSKCNDCKKTVLKILKENEKILIKHQYLFLVVHPKDNYGYSFDKYNILTIKRQYIRQVIAVFAKLGLKATEFNKTKFK